MLNKLSLLYSRQKASQKGVKYIFCINSGRAGSEYLSTLLDCAPEAYSFHEPKPQMIGKHLHLIAQRGLKSTFNSRRIKSKEILKKVSHLPERSVYVETNHMFIKTFYDVAIHDLKHIDVIYLQRDFLQTLKSFVQLCYFSERNTAWSDWMISPNAKTAQIKCIGKDHELDYIDLSIAYLIDIEARARSFQQQYTNVPFYEVNLEDLNDIDHAKNLFEKLDLSFTMKAQEMIGKKINQRSHVKKNMQNQIDELDLMARIQAYYRKGQELGIVFPERFLEYV